GASGTLICSHCMLSGIALVGGTWNPLIGQVGATPTIFNDQTVTLSPGIAFLTNFHTESLTHDIVADFRYPFGNGTTAGLSYNSTVISGYNQFGCDISVDPVFGGGEFNFLGTANAGDFERFNTLHATINTTLLKKLDGQLSLYVNQYQYHIPDPNVTTQTRFINSYSYFNSPRFGFEWRPQADIAVRASAGAGISPIDIANLVGQNQLPQPSAQPPTYYTVQLANPNLRPETSFGEDIGASLRLNHVSTLSADIYNTILRGQFFSNYELAGSYLGLPLYASQTRNLAHSRYEGIELTYDERPPTGFFWTLQGSLQRGFAYDVPASFYTSSAGPYSTNLTIISNENFDGGMGGIGRVAYAQGYAVLGWQNI